MDSVVEVEAGPSSIKQDAEPVFRKRGKGSRPTPRTRILGSEEQATPDRDAPLGDTPQNGEEDDDGEGTSVADLLALRALQRRPGGIELTKLNKGENKKKKKKKQSGAATTEEERWAEQMRTGGLVGSGGGGAGPEEEDSGDEEEEGDQKAQRKLVRQDNFQGETGTLDVDKHMMAYIESQMALRRAGSGEALTAQEVATRVADPEDELYRVAEKYRAAVEGTRKKAEQQDEGSAVLSAAMLTSIPEFDLGMDNRLKNIADTEKAKRAHYEARDSAKSTRNEADEALAAARFFKSRAAPSSDAEALRQAKAAAEAGLAVDPDILAAADAAERLDAARASGHKSARRDMASDEQVLERFKKRQRQGLK